MPVIKKERHWDILSHNVALSLLCPVAAVFLLHDDSLLVMTRLPDTDCRAIRLYLIDIAPFDPNVLRLLDRLLNDDWLLNDDRLLNDRRRRHDCRSGLNNHGFRVVRTRNRSSNHATDEAADKARPERTTAMMMTKWTLRLPRSRCSISFLIP